MSQDFIAVKTHYDHKNSYKGKHLTDTGLQPSGLIHCCHGGKHGARKKAKNSTFRLAGSRRTVPLGLAWASENPKPTPNDTFPPMRSHLL